MNRRGFVLSSCGAVLASLAALAGPGAALAQGLPRRVRLDEDRLGDAFEFQQDPVWCWAACIQLALRYCGFDITQQEIVQRTFGTVIPSTAGWVQITQNLNYVGPDATGAPHVVSASAFSGSPSGEVIVNHLEEDKPIILAYNNPGTFIGHAVVVTGIGYRVLANRIVIDELFLRDPFPYTEQHVANNGRRHIPNVITATNMWLVDAAPLPG